MFAANGRIGRVRYLAYSYGTMFIMMLVFGILAGLMAVAGGKAAVGVTIFLMYIPILVIAIIMAKRRLNDLNHSGWLTLLMLVPLVNGLFGLYLMFAPGTKGSNNYGPAPVKNSTGVIIGGLMLPVSIALIGILAAIAIPQYQNYVNKAKAAQTQSEAQAVERTKADE